MPQILRWIGYIIRMNEDRLVKKVLSAKIEVIRSRGKPRTRWSDALENYFRELKVKRWKKTTEDRNPWATFIKEVKVLRGP